MVGVEFDFDDWYDASAVLEQVRVAFPAWRSFGGLVGAVGNGESPAKKSGVAAARILIRVEAHCVAKGWDDLI